ncbi:heparan-alpha-glucosaminide N-acetyltransferase [uncultured Shimia sp.]|uniref:heparan-alpha-glucosaminide N-acetyltransferase n=1 Tax=uncultured Shimia sp. TaxID=573152 RepID=UPI00261110F8|nr:heparan-alpha-glucosaminide N-acetyltransferase [uncultured Shimia sp.]
MMFTGSEIRGNRLLFLDVARTIALFGMIVFHFFRDLEVFGMIAQGTTLNVGWAIFARAIAGSFLFLSGVSLVLAHARGFRGKAWLRRVVLISGAACLVTLATYAAFPSQFVFFGILHALALASLLGVPFLFAPVWVSLIGAVSILIASATVGRAVFTSPWMAWTGLGMEVRASLDFIPIVPWMAPFLLGVALARIAYTKRFEPTWPRWFPAQAVAWPGRHSLAVYLLHQPILLALIGAAAKVMK